MVYPLTFEPIFKERIWGGRNLEQLYGKALQPNVPIGESWEISDRPGDVSVISNGRFKGKTLHWLIENHGNELFGAATHTRKQFPLLIKILDAREKLSLQVHPPASVAGQLKGEPKTEMWYIAHADPGAELYVGLKNGVTRADFERKIKDGSVEECFHRIPVKAGDAMFLPSGRVHAIGAGLVIFEVQQNSDTTYRVFDWNRVDQSGKGRELHVEQSLASIDFNDFEPPLLTEATKVRGSTSLRPLVKHELFHVSKVELQNSTRAMGGAMQIIGMLTGSLNVSSGGNSLTLAAGQFCLIPAACDVEMSTEGKASFLQIHL